MGSEMCIRDRYTVTGSYEGTETLDKKLRRIMEQNAADDKNGITEDADE